MPMETENSTELSVVSATSAVKRKRKDLKAKKTLRLKRIKIKRKDLCG